MMPLRPFIVHNLWLKIFSLFFATLIWFAVQSNQSDYKLSQSLFTPRLQTLELRCPLTVMTSPGSGSTFNVQPSGVIVKVRGEDGALRNLAPESIQAYVKLTEGPHVSRLLRVEVIVPKEVIFREVIPDQVSVQWIASTNR